MEGLAGPQLWRAYMNELRETHLGIPSPDPQEPSVTAQLARAYADACAAEAAAA